MISDFGMAHHLFALRISEYCGLAEDGFVISDLADIMHETCGIQFLYIFLAQTHLDSNAFRNLDDSLGREDRNRCILQKTFRFPSTVP